MAPQERREVIQLLEDSREEFNRALRDLANAQASTVPGENRWSVLQCVEHVALVEQRFLGWLKAAKPSDTSRIDKEREAGLLGRLLDRSNRVVAPDAVAPTGSFPSLADAIDRFNEVRTETVRFAESHFADLCRLSFEHPRFGVMNGFEALNVIAGHCRRHADQIREIRASLA